MDRVGVKRAIVCGLGMAGACIAIMAACRRSAGGTDWLTGAGDRAAFRNILRKSAPGGIVLARLRGLGHINRTQGYRAGDEAISRAAKALRMGSGTGGALYRIGGRTFVLVLPRRSWGTPELAAARSVRAYGPGNAGERLDVGWAAGPGTVSELLSRAQVRLVQEP